MTSNGVFTGCDCSSRWLFALKRRVATAYLFPLGILAIHYVTSICMGHAEGFVSVDCGAPAGEYRDSKTTIEWVSDTGSGFASGLQGEGVSVAEAVHAPADISKYGEGQSLNSVRYFPGEQSKYCYVFSQEDYPFITPGFAFLVRATFWAANLDFGATTTTNTTFQLLINADIWDDVSITLPQSEVVVKEAYLLPTNNTSPPSISVCLAGRGANSSKGIPFISSLELRLLPPEFTSYYLSDFGLPLHCIYTVNYGAAPNDVIRYPDDHIDRIWQPDTSSHPQTTTREIDWQTLHNAAPPPKVLRTAYVEDEQIMLILPVPKGDHLHYYVAEYILDVSGARQSGQRVFTWQTTGYDPNSTVDLFDHDQGFITLSPGIDTPLHAEGYGYLAFSLTKAPNSTYGPLINALQLFREFGETVSPGTYIEDVDAINFIRTKHFTSLKSSSGDPCLPYPYNWLNCTHDLESPTRVSHLLMSNKSLEGTLPPKINSLQALVGIYLDRNKLSGDIPDLRNLDQLQTLDLSNNNFIGPVPTFLADLPSLTTLLLDNNNFTGAIPQAILDKFSSPPYKFSASGNPLLCPNITCTTKPEPKKLQIGLVASLASASVAVLVVIIILGTTIYMKGKSGMPMHNFLSRVTGKAKECRCFTYAEVRSITNNFERQLGVGGFGPVYYGDLPDRRPVAVKVLSAASHQGEREFLNEVDLLSRIHHKNLVALLGYCVEQKLVLIYEYMFNGSLLQALHDKGKYPILNTWKDHLKVAVDAAEGLEYLHNGCSPAIVHRDVKSSNILLSQEKGAKLCDFGISRSKVSTTDEVEMFTSVQGSVGYLDPEYAQRPVVTHKVDVYAFGVVLLEICSGRPLFSERPGQEPQYLADWAKFQVERGDIDQVLNPCFDGHYNTSSAWKVIEVAMSCLESESRKRPNMSEVCLELRSALSIELQGEVDSNTDLTITTEIKAR